MVDEVLSHRLKIAIIQTKIPYFKAAQLHKQNAVMYACAVRECACMGGAGVSACGAARYMRIRLERYYFFMTYGNIIFLQL